MEKNLSKRNVLTTALFVVTMALTSTAGVAARFTPYAKSVSLENVPFLSFQKWKLTNYKRNEPIYQLKCLSGCEVEPGTFFLSALREFREFAKAALQIGPSLKQWVEKKAAFEWPSTDRVVNFKFHRQQFDYHTRKLKQDKP